MPTKTLLFVVLVLLGVGLFNQTAYRVLETEKAILLEFGNLVDASIEPGLHFKLPVAEEVKKFDARVLTLDSKGETYYTLEKKPLIVDSFVKWLAIRAKADRDAVVLEAEAYRESEQLRGDGDAKAANVYASAYNKNPEFYSFYRSINAYSEVFNNKSDLLVLDPSSDFFKYLQSGDGKNR